MHEIQRSSSIGTGKRVELRGWIVFAAPTLLFIMVQALRSVLSSTVGVVEETFNVGAAAFSMASGIYFFFYAPSQLLSGLFVDWIGSRFVLFASGLVCAVATFVFAMGDDMFSLAAGRAISGFASGVPLLVAIYLASIWLPLDRLPFATGLVNGLGALGSFFAIWFLPALLLENEWSVVMTWFSGTWVIFSVLMLLLVPKRPSWALPSGHEQVFRKVFSGISFVLRIKRFWVLVTMAMCIVGPLSVLGGLWGARYLELIRGWSQGDASLASGTVFLGFTVGAILSGLIGQSRLLVRLVAIGSGVLSSGATVELLFLGDYSVVVGVSLMFLVGLGTGVVSLMYAMVAIITKTEHRAIGTALILFPTMLGSGIIQAVSGRIIQTAQDRGSDLEGAFVSALLLPVALSSIGVLVAVIAVIHTVVRRSDR